MSGPYDRKPILIALHERNFTMTELARSAAADGTPLGSSDAFKTQAERRAELHWMRTIATMLLVLMSAIYLAVRRAPASWIWGSLSQRVRRSRHGGGVR